MKKVLFYVEPHPIRNLFIEFITPAEVFIDAALHDNFSGIEWRMFSNDFLLNLISEKHVSRYQFGMSTEGNIEGKNVNEDWEGEVDFELNTILAKFKENLIYPEDEDTVKIHSFLSEWNESQILLRNELVEGVGELSRYYEQLLEKIYQNYKFTHIVLWSENGAVRNFCEKFNIQPIHMELGPTRRPFQDTILIDTSGTNGNSSFCKDDVSNKNNSVACSLWSSDFYSNDYISVQEMLLTPAVPVSAINKHGTLSLLTGTEFEDNLRAEINRQADFIDNYVVICLQLADDLNTLNHSDYLDPKHFLSETIPKVISLGYKVFIKRHPGARGRIFNLIKEKEAIDFAINISKDVYILDAETSQHDFIRLTKNATAVISINSSVSCESWIVGVPGLIMGKAAYDIKGRLQKLTSDFLNGGDLITDKKYLGGIQSSIEYGLNNYFIPRSNYVISACLAKVVNDFNNQANCGFANWFNDNIDIFKIINDEKANEANRNLMLLSKKHQASVINFANLTTFAVPNVGFYLCEILNFDNKNNQVIVEGRIAISSVNPVYIFIEDNNKIFMADDVETNKLSDDDSTSGKEKCFIIKAYSDKESLPQDEFNIYIHGSDGICRYIRVIK